MAVVVHVLTASHVGTHGEVAESFGIIFRIMSTTPGLAVVVATLCTSLVIILVIVIFVLVTLLTAVIVIAVLLILALLATVVVIGRFIVISIAVLAIVVLATVLVILIIGVLAVGAVVAVAIIVLALTGLLRMAGHYGQLLEWDVQAQTMGIRSNEVVYVWRSAHERVD